MAAIKTKKNKKQIENKYKKKYRQLTNFFFYFWQPFGSVFVTNPFSVPLSYFLKNNQEKKKTIELT